MSDKESRFDAYEYTGVIAPGAIIVFAATLVWPELKAYVVDDGTTLGGLGIFLILSYAVGHLVQGIGNLLEDLFWWPFGGLPSQWLLGRKQQLLADTQTKKLLKRVRELYPGFNSGDQSKGDWFAVTREIYTRANAARRSQRIDAFNRSYGMMRGMAGALLAMLVALPFLQGVTLQTAGFLAVLFLLALLRMYAFGVTYARELFLVFISLNETK